MSEELLDLKYDERYRVTIPQRKGRPDFPRFDLHLDQHAPPLKGKDWLPGLEDVLTKGAKQHILRMRETLAKNSQVRQVLVAFEATVD
jgi:hypothetical protein